MKKETLLGIALNVIFVLSIFSIRYYYAKQEMDFLVNDSVRQDEIIKVNKLAIDSLALLITKLQIDNETQDKQIKKYSTDLYEIIRWSKEYEQRLQNLIEQVEEMRLELASVESSTVPFLKEFGNQDSYIKVFGRTGLRIKDNKIIDSETIADFEGELSFGSPKIEQFDKYEFKAVYPDNEFLNLRIKGGQSEVIKLRPPRNQISIGPMLGVLYNTDTGLTTPTIGVGVTYNMIKLWDWK
jgi:hypothetical protein